MAADLETIKAAIGGLPEPDRMALAAWLNVQAMDEWDLEMKDDLSSGERAK